MNGPRPPRGSMRRGSKGGGLILSSPHVWLCTWRNTKIIILMQATKQFHGVMIIIPPPPPHPIKYVMMNSGPLIGWVQKYFDIKC